MFQKIHILSWETIDLSVVIQENEDLRRKKILLKVLLV